MGLNELHAELAHQLDAVAEIVDRYGLDVVPTLVLRNARNDEACVVMSAEDGADGLEAAAETLIRHVHRPPVSEGTVLDALAGRAAADRAVRG